MNDIPEKIITDEDAKPFEAQSTVFIFDNIKQAELCGDYSTCVVGFVNPVQVRNADNKLLGCANLELQGTNLVASFLLDPSTPERLDIETGSVKLYPFVNAQVNSIYEDHTTKFTKMLVEGLTLTPNKTLDDRIGAVNV